MPRGTRIGIRSIRGMFIAANNSLGVLTTHVMGRGEIIRCALVRIVGIAGRQLAEGKK